MRKQELFNYRYDNMQSYEALSMRIYVVMTLIIFTITFCLSNSIYAAPLLNNSEVQVAAHYDNDGFIDSDYTVVASAGTDSATVGTSPDASSESPQKNAGDLLSGFIVFGLLIGFVQLMLALQS